LEGSSARRPRSRRWTVDGAHNAVAAARVGSRRSRALRATSSSSRASASTARLPPP